MYVFAHNAEAGEHATISQSIHGEDLPFVFGAPLGNAGPFQTQYNAEERLLSEAVMRYFSNFAKTGNPTVPWNHRFHNLGPIDWDKYDVDWQEFNEINQNYLHLGTQPIVSQRYRHRYTKYWNEGLIETMRNANSLSQYGKFSNSPITPRNLPSMVSGQVISMYPIKVEIENPTEDPLRELRYRLQKNPESPYYSPNSFVSRGQTHGSGSGSTAITSPVTEPINFEQISTDEHEILTNEATTMYLLISVIVTFLLVNMVGLVIYLYRRHKRINRKYDNANIFDACSEDKRSKFNDTDDSFILDIIRKSSNNTYESVKRHSLINGYGINRQTSTSTVDTHTKVNDWISNEITKYSPHANGHIAHSQQNSFSTNGGGGRKEKVSVAIDATPQARSNSILRQEPIEVTKAKSSLDYGVVGKIICQEVDMDVSMIDEVGIYSNNNNGSIDERNESDSSSCSCSSFSQCCEECAIHELKMPPYGGELMTSFMGDNVNVTSRDSPQSSTPLSPEESLKAIQKMNCPKVLPSYPEHVQLNDATKRRSLQVPPQYYQIHGEGNSWDTFNRQNSSSSTSSSSSSKPEPPPRLSSTLGRRPSRSNEDRSSRFMTMPHKAQEPPKSTVPDDTTESTLIVGPLIPKSENIYMTMQRKKSLSRQNSQSSSCEGGNQQQQQPEDNSRISLECDEVGRKNDERFNDDSSSPIYAEIIKNSRVQTPQDGIYSITASAGNKHLGRKSSANSQESNSSTSSSSESSTGTIKKIN
jgi:neuroligin